MLSKIRVKARVNEGIYVNVYNSIPDIGEEQ